MYRWELGKNIKSEYYVKFVASNNEIIIWSEGYKTKQGAINAINLVKTYGLNAPINER